MSDDFPWRRFRKASPAERLGLLEDGLSPEERAGLRFGTASAEALELADVMVENAFSTLPLPLGLAGPFLVDGKEYRVPLACEEPSVIAAASFAALRINRAGGFETEVSAPLMQAHLYLEKAPPRASEAIKDALPELEKLLEEPLRAMTDRGGGLKKLDLSVLPETGVLRLELTVDVRDALGANLLNTCAERLRKPVEHLSGARTLMAILSNQAKDRLVRARFRMDAAELAQGAYRGIDLAERIVLASGVADEDPARAVTHNKGIMNGISSLALATANDTRAVEAAAHAWACRSGRYRALSSYRLEDGHLVGEIELPLALATVGGAVSFHPTAKSNLAVLGNPDSGRLSRVAAALGLAQNFAALSALCGEGIQEGHMRLHARRLAYKAGARGEAIETLAGRIHASGVFNEEGARRLFSEES